MRRDLRQLSKQFKKATEVEKTALSDLRDNIRDQLKVARRTERIRRRRKERDRAGSRFTSDPFQFTSRFFLVVKGQESWKLKEEVEKYLKEMHSDPNREVRLDQFVQLIEPGEPTNLLMKHHQSIKGAVDIIKKARAASARGPNGVPYKVYKNCQRLTRHL